MPIRIDTLLTDFFHLRIYCRRSPFVSFGCAGCSSEGWEQLLFKSSLCDSAPASHFHSYPRSPRKWASSPEEPVRMPGSQGAHLLSQRICALAVLAEINKLFSESVPPGLYPHQCVSKLAPFFSATVSSRGCYQCRGTY